MPCSNCVPGKPCSEMSPHCTSGNCSFCKERRRRAAAPPLVSQPGDHWERKIGLAGDIFGYWHMTIPPARTDPKIKYMKPPHPGGVMHRKIYAWR